MIFKVEPVPTAPEGMTLVARGSQLCFLDLPMIFMVTSTVVPNPFPIRFTVREDPTKKTPEVEQQNITEAGLDIILYNPYPSGQTMSTSPWTILTLANPPIDLRVHFIFSRLQNVKHSLFFFEFYEQAKPAPTQTEPTAAPN
jgi:hypothetical protein